MKSNRTELCEECNSHMMAIKTPTRIIYECSYCGSTNNDELNPLDDDNEDYE